MSANVVPDFWFLSFADSRLRGPLRRIRRQAHSMGVFGDHVHVWTEQDLDESFRERMRDHLVPGSRGYGFWAWKPQVILQIFREMPEGDVLLYVDAGCHLNPKGVPRLLEYRELAREHGLVTFQARALGEAAKTDPALHFLPDAEWSKGDLLDFFGVRGKDEVLRTGQMGGGIFLVRKCAQTHAFFEEFRSVFYDHFELCDDSPSVSPNLPGFHENRHDQSVLSLLCKRNRSFSLSCAEYSPIGDFIPKDRSIDPAEWPTSWHDLRNRPIWARHDKGGWRALIPDSVKKLVRRILR